MITLLFRQWMQIFLGYLRPVKLTLAPSVSNPLRKKVVIDYRCWPIDIDFFMHMNNSNYIRMSELARWRIFPSTNMMSKTLSQGWLFLAVDQRVQYLKPIKPFQRYSIETTLSSTNDKWLHYEHTFVECSDSVKHGEVAKIYAQVSMKAVLKRSNGMTVRLSELKDLSDFNQEMVEVIQKNSTFDG